MDSRALQGRRGAGGAEALHLPGKRLGDILRQGPLPGSLQELNTKVWQEWYPNEGQKYCGTGNAMLEVYSPGDMQSPDYECGIWVPICKPVGQSKQEAAETVSTIMITGIL